MAHLSRSLVPCLKSPFNDLEFTTGQIAHQRLVHRCVLEGELIDLLGQRQLGDGATRMPEIIEGIEFKDGIKHLD